MRNEELQQRMRTICHEATQRYDLDNIGTEWLRLFKEL